MGPWAAYWTASTYTQAPTAWAISVICRTGFDRPQGVGGVAHRHQARLFFERAGQVVQIERAVFGVKIHPAHAAAAVLGR